MATSGTPFLVAVAEEVIVHLPAELSPTGRPGAFSAAALSEHSAAPSADTHDAETD